jgi:hypothetical protein
LIIIKCRKHAKNLLIFCPLALTITPFCSLQIFDSKSDLLLHSQHVHKQDPKPYKCPTCSKCFANSSYLSQHARIHAGIKPYKCGICERRFTQLCHLQQHTRTHTGEKPYKCQHPGCGKAFSQLSNLQSHSRSHMTDKPYRCNSCYKCFADEQGLRDHIPKHSDTKHLKTHICQVCGKSYTQETYLQRHMAKHQVNSSGGGIGNSGGDHHHHHHAGSGVNSGGGGTNHHKPVSSPPTPTIHHHHPDHDIKPPMAHMGSSSSLTDMAVSASSPDGGNKPSAFMPLAHQFSAHPSAINNQVPSSSPFFMSSRLPSSTLSSPLPIHSSVSPSRYFPFDHVSFKRDSMPGPRDSMLAHANSLLSLQQIKNYTSTHAVFSKSEPSSPVHKDAAFQ